MAGVFKAGRGGYYPVQPTTDTVVIDNSIKVKPVAPQAPLQETVTADTAENTAVTDEASAKHRQELEQEKEKITSYYREQGEKALADAREKAQRILSETEQQAQDYAAQAKAQAEAIFEKSRSDGFAKGHEDGYAAGLDKCRDMLSELKRLSEQMVSDKAELFDSYEVEIFDTVMEIVNRITLNSLGQKDKAVVKKTIKEAGKSFRGSEYVKLTLSKDMDKELKELQKQFMPEDTKAGLIQSFLDNFKGTQVCSKLIYAEALNHPFDEPKQWEIREINEIMNNSIEGWKPFSNPRSFAKYGRQRGWERIPPPDNEPSATGSNLTDGFRELTEEEARQMELPF